MIGSSSQKFRSFAATMLVILSLTPVRGEEHQLLLSFITTRTGDLVSSGAIPMVDLALEQINNHTSILPGYSLDYTSVLDSQVSGLFACCRLRAKRDMDAHTAEASYKMYRCM